MSNVQNFLLTIGLFNLQEYLQDLCCVVTSNSLWLAWITGQCSKEVQTISGCANQSHCVVGNLQMRSTGNRDLPPESWSVKVYFHNFLATGVQSMEQGCIL